MYGQVILCKFEWYPLKFHMKYLTHSLKDSGLNITVWGGCFLVHLYLKVDNLPVNSGCPKAKSGWIWQVDNLWYRALKMCILVKGENKKALRFKSSKVFFKQSLGLTAGGIFVIIQTTALWPLLSTTPAGAGSSNSINNRALSLRSTGRN